MPKMTKVSKKSMASSKCLFDKRILGIKWKIVESRKNSTVYFQLLPSHSISNWISFAFPEILMHVWIL